MLFVGAVVVLLALATCTNNNWPPVVDKSYPDLELVDQEGTTFHLSSLKGKVIIVEPIGMSNAACQAFSGAHRHGSFGGISAQENLLSFEDYFRQYTRGLSLSDEGIVFVQILFYDSKLEQPKWEDARKWAEHFKLTRTTSQIVAVPARDMRGKASNNLIPGFQLIDRKFILRYDSTGHSPRHNLYTELLPAVRRFLGN